jgi:nucleolar protein 9
MPKENKHARGRRGDKKEKRKREDDGEVEVSSKRRRSAGEEEIIQFHEAGEDVQDYSHEAGGDDPIERQFYGLLNDEEQEYFRHADELLELNNFPSPEERALFIANVFKEANDKELKIACSQSCSRLMERLILLSTKEQKKTLFEKFSGNFLHLMMHRFASHCCEALFVHSAAHVTEELVGDAPEPTTEDDTVFVTFENLYIHALNELEGHFNVLLTDKFASHTLRVLLIVLSGKPLAKSATHSMIRSKKKEHVGITGLEAGTGELTLDKRTVPESFTLAVDKIINDTAASMDETFTQVLVTHPTGNPTLQLVLELELTRKVKQKPTTETPSISQKLLPDDISAENSRSASLVNGLIYDPTGSRLLETIITFAPGKLFKQIYRTTFQERIASLARNEIASFVVIKVLERLSKHDLEEAVKLIIPQIPSLVERHRSTVLKALLERCNIRAAASSLAALTKALEEAYGSDPATLITKMTNTTTQSLAITASTEITKPVRTDPTTVHGSLLAQTMLSIAGPQQTLIQNALLALQPQTIHHLCLTTSTSHILQASLQPSNANLVFRRKLINAILSPLPPPSSDTANEQQLDPIIVLATSKPGSHVLDALWVGTNGLMMLRERIAGTLKANEALLRQDYVGRVVLRNWHVELFGRRKGDWVKNVKEMEVEMAGKEGVKEEKGQGRGKETGKPQGRGKLDVPAKAVGAGRGNVHASRLAQIGK